MTSNLGSEHFRKLTSPLGFLSRDVGVEQVQGEVMRELERRFPPEFRNRIDEVVLFAPLTHDEVREIAKHYLAQVDARRWPRPARRFTIDDEALELIVTQGYSMAFGARFLKRVIDEQIKLPISAQLEGRLALRGQRERRRDRRRARAGDPGRRRRRDRVRRRRLNRCTMRMRHAPVVERLRYQANPTCSGSVASAGPSGRARPSLPRARRP